MAIADTGVPTTDPHTMLSTLITDHMDSPDGSWTVVVNTGWLNFKQQKTFQISIMPGYGMAEDTHLAGDSDTMPRRGTQFMIVTLYADTRAKHWKLYRVFTALMNKGSLTRPDLTGEGVDGTPYHFIKIIRSEETKAVDMMSPKKGMGGDAEGDCIGYQSQHTVMVRWNE